MSPLRPLVFALLIFTVPAAAQRIVRLPAADVPLRARPSVVYTVGAEDGAEWETFGNVTSVAFDSRDNLYVFDQGNARVIVFDPAGKYVRTIGRRGGGPGELSAPSGMTVTPRDELVVADVGRKAFSIFGPDGVFRRSVPFARGTVYTGRLMPHPGGGVVARALGNPLSRAADAGGEDVVVWQPFGEAAPSPLLTISTPRSRAGAPRKNVAFAPTTRLALLADGRLAVAKTEEYALELVTAAGATAPVVRPVRPRRVTAHDRELETERLARYSRPGGLSLIGPQSGPLPASLRGAVASQLQNVEFAEVMPVIRALSVDASGNLWIQRDGAALDRSGPIDVVTPQGRYIGTLSGTELPTAFSRHGRAAYVATGEDGVQRAVVVRVPPLR